MDRNQLVITIAAALFLAFALGWLVGLIWARLGRRTGPAAIDALTRQLAEQRMAYEDLRSEAAAHHATLSDALAARKADIARLEQALGDARLEVDTLRAYIDRQTG